MEKQLSNGSNADKRSEKSRQKWINPSPHAYRAFTEKDTISNVKNYLKNIFDSKMHTQILQQD